MFSLFNWLISSEPARVETKSGTLPSPQVETTFDTLPSHQVEKVTPLTEQQNKPKYIFSPMSNILRL